MVEREGRWEDTKEEKSEKWVESRQATRGERQGRRKRRNKRWEEGEKGPGKCQVHREHTPNNKAAQRCALDARNTIKRRHVFFTPFKQVFVCGRVGVKAGRGAPWQGSQGPILSCTD